MRDAVLAILLLGPAYGFQVHGALAERTGGRRRINVGQTYGTLDRLAKQQLVEPAGATDDGLPLHRLTRAGRAAALAWLGGADATGADPWDETVDRVLVARSIDGHGVDADAIVAVERERWARRRADAAERAEPTDAAERAEPEDPAAALARLAAAAEIERAGAALSWLAHVAAHPSAPVPVAADRPRRGRRPVARDEDQPSASA
ncbi:PadR family transcriptional regulator [Agromyces larvae]|uniref:PadR family transcriptional regulator n=1 Tax=Agromyces larvae TaxID=2929802 RepID=A0ABY4C0I3_9MICO|nr:helix-turn-helix transcriptional regulator [Agromyces larvae]UOE45005.1 PadR family transcriptional regulator [Agromyces larvae]